MAKHFDITSKQLVALRPTDWLRLAGLEADVAEIENVNLATVAPDADTVVRVRDTTDWLANMEFQASYDGTLPDRGVLYEVVLVRKYGLDVETVMFLLRPEADGPAMTGVLRRYKRDGTLKLEFHYTIIRLWQVPVEEILQGGLATLAVAPLAAGAEADLSDVLHRIEQRVAQEMPAEELSTFWTATYIMTGLKYPKDTIARALRGVRDMRESVTYQAILDEGREEGREEGRMEGREEGELTGERNSLLRVGRKRLGDPPAWAEERVAAETAKSELDDLLDRVLDVESWDELFGASE